MKIKKISERFEKNKEDNRTMLFYQWYGYKLDDTIPEFNNDYKYIKTIGVSLFRKKHQHLGILVH